MKEDLIRRIKNMHEWIEQGTFFTIIVEIDRTPARFQGIDPLPDISEMKHDDLEELASVLDDFRDELEDNEPDDGTPHYLWEFLIDQIEGFSDSIWGRLYDMEKGRK